MSLLGGGSRSRRNSYAQRRRSAPETQKRTGKSGVNRRKSTDTDRKKKRRTKLRLPSVHVSSRGVFLVVRALLALALVLVQELLLGHYWPNWAGVASQFFFLPLINLTGILPLHYLWLDDVVISLVLFFISLAICRKKQKVIQANEEHP